MKIKVPTSWVDVSIKEFMQLRNNFEDKTLDAIDLMVSNIATLSKEDYSNIDNIPIDKLKEIYSKISFIYSTDVDGEFPNTVFLGDKMYSVNPDIRMNYGQFKAIREFSKTVESANDNLHKIVALFLFENGKPYDYDYDNKCKYVLEHCKMNVVFKLTGFFLPLHEEFVKTSQYFSLKKAEMILEKAKKELEQEKQPSQPKKNLWRSLGGLFSKKIF